jgi:sulfite dehydrogenase (cytochrome) subunit A
MISRRSMILTTASALTAAAALPWLRSSAWANGEFGPSGLPNGTLDASILDALPGKRPLIKKAFRPPNYETPISVFNETVTPNDAFFVRYHLANIPQVDAKAYRIKVGGEAAEHSFELSLDDLKTQFPAVEVMAVLQCSGNRRGLSDPHVAGVEWGYGAMGNAVWKGARLKDVLAKAGLKKEALEIVLNGADTAVAEKTPDFQKSLPVSRALDDNTLIAYEMNGEPLPHWNGSPARIVVPGWTGTYWMKHVVSISAVSQPFKGFWMAAAYRIPKGKFPVVDRFISQESEANTPITEMVVNSLITSPATGQGAKARRAIEVKGIAWDGGYGIAQVEVSTDGGETWRGAQLGKDLGKYAWRQWSYSFTPSKSGEQTVLAKATNRLGVSQPSEAIWNPAGYHHNVVSRITLAVA